MLRLLKSRIITSPAVTYIMQQMKEQGFDVDTDATTIAEARDEILRVLGR